MKSANGVHIWTVSLYGFNVYNFVGQLCINGISFFGELRWNIRTQDLQTERKLENSIMKEKPNA